VIRRQRANRLSCERHVPVKHEPGTQNMQAMQIG
jgi:hypothetical protein